MLASGQFIYLSLQIATLKKYRLSLTHSFKKSSPIAALNMTSKQRNKPYSMLVHHSYKDAQYCSYEYLQLLRNSNIAISMTEQKDAYENTIAERMVL